MCFSYVVSKCSIRYFSSFSIPIGLQVTCNFNPLFFYSYILDIVCSKEGLSSLAIFLSFPTPPVHFRVDCMTALTISSALIPKRLHLSFHGSTQIEFQDSQIIFFLGKSTSKHLDWFLPKLIEICQPQGPLRRERGTRRGALARHPPPQYMHVCIRLACWLGHGWK